MISVSSPSRPSAMPTISTPACALAWILCVFPRSRYLADVCALSTLQHAVAAGLEQRGLEFYSQLAVDHESKCTRIPSTLGDCRT
jgi:hypothetical protein